MFFKQMAQAALEFIITYGWAIMIGIIAVAALAYFGVLSPDRMSAEKCILAPGLSCLYHIAVVDNRGYLYEWQIKAMLITLKNNMGYDLNNFSLTASGCAWADDILTFQSDLTALLPVRNIMVR